jgi:4-alpha-glucanotransferase
MNAIGSKEPGGAAGVCTQGQIAVGFPSMDDVAELAARWGIETTYTDALGRQQTASAEAVRHIADILARTGVSPAAPMPHIEPQAAYQGDGRRHWLLAVQLYAVRSRCNWGHGDFTDLAALINLAADVGAAGVGLNPLHVLFTDRPEDASPYAPNSRLFLNPLYIDVTALPEFAPDQTSPEVERLRTTDMVDYANVARAKLEALRHAYRTFRTSSDVERKKDFEDFRAERGHCLRRFAAFETLRRRFKSVWWEWPDEWRKPSDGALQRLCEEESDETGFHEFLQWNADRQLRACRDLAERRRLPIGLYIDLAVGVDAGGADAWTQQDSMLIGLSVGAPPDALQPAGQNWGLTTYNPHALAARQFEPLREMLRDAMRYAGAVRLDHVLGLKRLYVIPSGGSARDGTYLQFPFEAMLEAISDESRRFRNIVIGEDLGTVPDGFRETLGVWGIWSYLVVLFEREEDGSFRHPSRYPENALATFNTHDLPTYRGWISGHDLRLKRSINLDPGESDEDRERARSAWRAAIAPADPDAFEHAVSFLAATPTRLISVALEDILAIEDQVNIPGTVAQHPNWQRRLPVAIEKLREDQRLLRAADACARAGRTSS